jgi:hypothetical protein
MSLVLNEPIQLSKTLANYLERIKSNPLVVRLRSPIERPKINYLDITINGKDVSLSFLDPKRVPQIKPPDNEFTTTLRQSSKIGRAIKKLLPETHDDDVRPLVEAIHSITREKGLKKFVVSGDDIRKVFQWPKKYCKGSGLHGSCYQGMVNSDEFELFANNPDKIKCIVMMEDGFLVGRELVFYGTVNGKPRIYFSTPNYLSTHAIQLDDYKKTISPEIPRYSWNQGGFTVGNLVPGKALHHFGLSYTRDKDGKSSELATHHGSSRSMSDLWFTNPDGKSPSDYTTWKRPSGVVVPPIDPASEGLEPFWPTE